MSGNQRISSQELATIRSLDDFDLTMLISEIHDHGWPVADRLLPTIVAANARRRMRPEGQGA